MRKNEVQRTVFGAMILALFGLLLVLDTYTGSLLNVLFYYIMPLPFIVYTLRYGISATLVVMCGAIILSLLLAVPETIFFCVSAMAVSLVIDIGLVKNMSGSTVFFLTMVVTIISQYLSLRVFAAWLGYDVKEELAFIPIDYLPLFVTVIGGVEAFIFTTFTDAVLTRLKLVKWPRFALWQLHLSKPSGIAALAALGLGAWLDRSWAQLLSAFALMALILQGLSLLWFYHLVKKHRRIWLYVSLLCCFIPGLHLFYALLGLYDIFSEIRMKLLYNKNSM